MKKKPLICPKIAMTRREEIVQEAAKLFKEKGFKATTMRDLADRIGIEAASIYNHIRSKDEILEELCFRISDTYIAQLTRIEAENWTISDKLKALLSLHVRIIISDTEGVSVANNEWKHLKPKALERFKAARRDYEKRLAALIEQGMEAGILRKMNVSVALFTLLSAVRWVELWYKPHRDIAPETLENDIIEILMSGLKI